MKRTREEEELAQPNKRGARRTCLVDENQRKRRKAF